MVHGLPPIGMPKRLCVESCESKQPRNSFKLQIRSNEKLEVIFSNVCGPLEVKTLEGNNYFMSSIDEITRKMWIYLREKE